MFIQDDDMVESLLAEGPDHALGNAVRLRTTEWAEDSLDADCSRPRDDGPPGLSKISERGRTG